MTYSYSYRVGSVKLLGLARLLGIWRASVYKLVFRELLIFCRALYGNELRVPLLLQSPVQKKIFEKIVVYSGTFESILRSPSSRLLRHRGFQALSVGRSTAYIHGAIGLSCGF
uniref:Bestrophin homolog n=1 Tax=Macrostomum lignano TaxID=282301 RepID=A0A1I8FBP1_9PLAT